MSNSEPLLEVRNLNKHFEQQTSIIDTLLRKKQDPVQAVDGVSFEIHENDSMAVIGESGCGKTTLLMTLMGLENPTEGEMIYKGEKVSEFGKADWKRYRRNVQLMFQDPFNSLDPKLKISDSLKEPLRIHNIEADYDQKVYDILEKVQLSPPEKYANRYPRNLSGGEKQRVSIARALILEPDLILADEPVSMLDVSTQAAILNLIEDLIEEMGVSMIYISHDLSTVSYVSQTINVMYLGRFVESAPTKKLLNNPKHPYSKALIQAIPVPDPHHKRGRTDMSGAPQDPVGLGDGCRFRDRCSERMDICGVTPKRVQCDDNHYTACHLYYDHEEIEKSEEHKKKADAIPESG